MTDTTIPVDEWRARLFVLTTAIGALQEEKERAYGIDWKRFGLVSSFFNVFRKFIRLRTLWRNGWAPTSDETRLDTIIDLLNYLILSALLHAELVPETFSKTHACASPERFPTNEEGFKRYVRTFVAGMVVEGDVAPLFDEIIKLGEETVERWLTDVADIAHSLSASTTTSTVEVPRYVLSPETRLRNIRTLIELCVGAAICHGKQYPDEWQTFMSRYESVNATS
jgi:hypothetical protein